MKHRMKIDLSITSLKLLKLMNRLIELISRNNFLLFEDELNAFMSKIIFDSIHLYCTHENECSLIIEMDITKVSNSLKHRLILSWLPLQEK